MSALQLYADIRQLSSEVESDVDLIDEIRDLRRARNAVILAHNYQVPAIQDVADFVGDSLGLSQAAADTGADVIVMCGVYFMAETAKVICPERTVLIPDLAAGCSLADSITADQLRSWKAEHPDAVVVSYVNTSAAVKAESDYCVGQCRGRRPLDSRGSRDPLLAGHVFGGARRARDRPKDAHLDG